MTLRQRPEIGAPSERTSARQPAYVSSSQWRAYSWASPKASTAAAAAPLPPRLNHFHCTYLIIVDCCGDLSHFRFGAAVPQDPAVARRGRTHDGSHLAPFLSGHGGCCLALFNGSASSHGWRSPRTAV